MLEKEDILRIGSSVTPEDAVARAMQSFPDAANPRIEDIVRGIEIADDAERVMRLLRSMIVDFRQLIPLAARDQPDAVLKARFAAALRRTGAISHDVCQQVIAIIDKRCGH